MIPLYKLQIVYPDGTALPFSAGGQFERDLIAACKDAILAKGVGVFRTEAHVGAAIETGMQEALLALKREAAPSRIGKKR